MPAKSKKQQMAAGAALAAKRGERKKSSLKGASKQMAESMSEKQLKDFAKTKRKTFLLNLMHTTKALARSLSSVILLKRMFLCH